MHNYIWCSCYIPRFVKFGSVVWEELHWQPLWWPNRHKDRQTSQKQCLSTKVGETLICNKYLPFAQLKKSTPKNKNKQKMVILDLITLNTYQNIGFKNHDEDIRLSWKFLKFRQRNVIKQLCQLGACNIMFYGTLKRDINLSHGPLSTSLLSVQ